MIINQVNASSNVSYFGIIKISARVAFGLKHYNFIT